MKISTLTTLVDYFKNCALCESYLKGQSSIYCKACWDGVFLNSKPVTKTLFKNIKSYFLWEWKESNSKEIQNIIYLMKEGKNRNSFSFLAEYLGFVIVENNHHKESVLVPVPSLKKQSKNHAYLLAEEIGKRFGIPIYDSLYWIHKNKQQKESSKKERLKVKMGLKGKTLDLNKFRIILIDDVVTSGATVLAAYKAFESPKVFCCYALSCKSLWTSGKINE